MRKGIIYLFVIVVLAGILRFYNIANIPPSLTWDEVAWGYNAYSLGIDGKDEFGRFLPYDYLESFGDFKPPVYAYLGILPVKIWGITEFATRFPSALFGTLTVLATFFLVLQIFYNSSEKEKIALFSSFILAISPWHINLSRAAFEANVAQFFIVLGVTFFLYAVNKKPWFLTLSAISFVISLYTFNTARVFVPVLVAVFGMIYYKRLLNIKKQTILAIFTGVLLILPIVGFLLSPQASLRFKEVNIFSDPKIIEVSNQEVANDGNAWWSKILHNRRVGYVESFVKHYFDNLSPRFLFISGDGNPKFSTQDIGQLYLWSLPFLIVGILFLFRRKEGYWYVIPVWFLLGIIPAATARETPHALRIETVIPTLQIVEAYGLVLVLNFLKNKTKYYKFLRFTVFIFLFMNVSYYLYGYYVHYARDYSGEWQYGYKESIEYVTSVEKNYDEIYISTVLGRPYIYYLFHQHRDPSFLREKGVVSRDAFGFVTVGRIGKYNFVDDPSTMKSGGRDLYIDDINKIPSDVKVLKRIKLLNGEDTLLIYER